MRTAEGGLPAEAPAFAGAATRRQVGAGRSVKKRSLYATRPRKIKLPISFKSEEFSIRIKILLSGSVFSRNHHHVVRTKIFILVVNIYLIFAVIAKVFVFHQNFTIM